MAGPRAPDARAPVTASTARPAPRLPVHWLGPGGPAPSQGRGCALDAASQSELLLLLRGSRAGRRKPPRAPEAQGGAAGGRARERLVTAVPWARLSMGLLSEAARCLVRGADRMSRWTSKRGPRTFYKGRGAKGTGVHGRDGKFVQVKEMVPELVVPELTGFRLKPYVNYRVPAGTDQPLTAKQLFREAVAPAIEKDFRDGAFDPQQLEKYGFEPTQEGKLFQLYPKNFPR